MNFDRIAKFRILRILDVERANLWGGVMHQSLLQYNKMQLQLSKPQLTQHKTQRMKIILISHDNLVDFFARKSVLVNINFVVHQIFQARTK